jgi:hypothetical protein
MPFILLGNRIGILAAHDQAMRPGRQRRSVASQIYPAPTSDVMRAQAGLVSSQAIRF